MVSTRYVSISGSTFHSTDHPQASFWQLLAMTAMCFSGHLLTTQRTQRTLEMTDWKIWNIGESRQCVGRAVARKYTIWHGHQMDNSSSQGVWIMWHGYTMLRRVRLFDGGNNVATMADASQDKLFVKLPSTTITFKGWPGTPSTSMWPHSRPTARSTSTPSRRRMANSHCISTTR